MALETDLSSALETCRALRETKKKKKKRKEKKGKQKEGERRNDGGARGPQGCDVQGAFHAGGHIKACTSKLCLMGGRRPLQAVICCSYQENMPKCRSCKAVSQSASTTPCTSLTGTKARNQSWTSNSTHWRARHRWTRSEPLSSHFLSSLYTVHDVSLCLALHPLRKKRINKGPPSCDVLFKAYHLTAVEIVLHKNRGLDRMERETDELSRLSSNVWSGWCLCRPRPF